MIYAIDPGTTESAWLTYDPDNQRPIEWGMLPNPDLVDHIAGMPSGMTCAIEMVESFGMPVGREVFVTCVWIGRFMQTWIERLMVPSPEPRLVGRKAVKTHLCGTPAAKDSNVVHALYDLYGGSRQRAVGVKGARGPLYGLKSHCFQALAVARTAAETRQKAVAA